MRLKDIKTIYFDFDGTLHNSIKIYAPSFEKGYEFLVSNNKAPKRKWNESEIKIWLGFTPNEMWSNFMKDLDESYQKKASAIIGEEMQRQMSIGTAELYDDAINVLNYLKDCGYTLVFLSNCPLKYMETAKQIFNLDKYFNSMICSEMYDFIPKHDILKLIKNNYKTNQVIIGDRFHDMESGRLNNIDTIFCQYGYGNIQEGKEATIQIKEINEILNIL